MLRFAEFVVASFATTLLTAGCMTVKSGVDPAYGKTKYEDLARPSEPFKWKVSVQFQVDGKPAQQADSTLRDGVERVLRASGLIVPTPESTSGEIHVVLNNITDKAAAAAKGFGTGLTLGLVGSTVTDYYEMEVTITANGKTSRKSGIRHALHTAVGNASLPAGFEAVPPATAFNRIVEQMLLNALKDFQEGGGLMSLRTSLRNATNVTVDCSGGAPGPFTSATGLTEIECPVVLLPSL
jgi:hypothetical protein